LPPGHTHEDIDSKFGVIWLRFRNKHISSPQEAATLFQEAFLREDRSLPVEVIDIFAVPDYWNYMVPFLNPNIGRAFKEEWTQLQWTFEAVDRTLEFPLGVKTTYRAYSFDVVNEIYDRVVIQLNDLFKAAATGCPYIPTRTEVRSFPEESPSNPSGGTCLLTSCPTGEMFVLPFPVKSRADFEETLGQARVTYVHDSTVIKHWEDFAENLYPPSDNVEEYCTRTPQHVPLFEILFNGRLPEVGSNPDYIPELDVFAVETGGILMARSMPSVILTSAKNKNVPYRELYPDPRLWSNTPRLSNDT